MRKPIVIGNWKMQLIHSEAEKLISAAKDVLKIFNNKAEILNNLADYIVSREK